MYPLDVLKTYIVVSKKECYGEGCVSHFQCMVRNQGILSVYKGATISLIGVAPFIAIRMASYDMLSTRLKPKIESPILVNGIAGMLAGCIATSICYPQDVVRRKV